MKILNRYIVLMVLPLLLSCNSFLDLKPYGKTIPKNAEEYSAMIHTMLNNIELDKDSYILPSTSDIITNEAIADNLDANIFLGQEVIPYYVGQRLNSQIYGRVYQNIRNCNIVLDGLANDNTELGKTVKSASYAIRGVSYFELLKYYCLPVAGGVYPELGMPIVDYFDMEARPVRSSYRETVEYIESNLIKALELNSDDDLYIFTSDVVKFYLARLYFWTAQWDKAIEISEQLLSKYPILDRENYSQMVLGSRKFDNMIVRYKSGLVQDQYVVDRVYSSLRNRPVNRDFIDIFDQPQNDIRLVQSVNALRNPIKLFIGALRSEELLLIAAESYYYKGDNSKTIELLNLLRSKRINNYEPITLNSIPQTTEKSPIVKDAMNRALTPLISFVINERRKEFFMEGDRFMELKRLGSPEFWVSRNGLVYTTMEFMYTYPIPADDIILNKGIIQNPGYTQFVD